MEKQYQGFKMIRTEKLATRYGFSATDKKIRVKAELYDTDSDLIFEEAILVRQLYCDEVAKCKSLGEKPKPQAIKTQCFLQAEQQMLAKYGNQYQQVIGGKVVKEYSPNKITEIKEDKKEVNQEVVQEVNQEFEDNLDSLMEEFTSTEPVVKIKQVDLSNLDGWSSAVGPTSIFP